MRLQGCRFRTRPTSLFALSVLLAPVFGLTLGCASPGAPRPPSLHLPQPVGDLAGTRSGDDVEIRFTIPSRTTDGLPLRNGPLSATLCRRVAAGNVCKPVTANVPLNAAGHRSTPETVLWTDRLPSELLTGSARSIAYQVQVSNGEGKSAGYSAPSYVAAGAAPLRVEGFQAQGIRSGVLLRWTPEAGTGEVLLEREQLDPLPASGPSKGANPATSRAFSHGTHQPAKTASDAVWLQAEPGNSNSAQTIDGTITEGVRYRYIAVRRIVAQVGGRSLELRSAPSSPAEIAWRDVYPPPTPQGLTAIGFAETSAASTSTAAYAVDLIWQPVVDLRVIGYKVTRVALSSTGDVQGAPEPLNKEPVSTPAFHDATAVPTQSYRYTVTAVDGKGNASTPAETTVQAAQVISAKQEIRR